MPTIRKRVGAKGTRFQAIIRRYRNHTQSYRETQTFNTRADAERWAKEREDALNNPAASVHARHSGGPCLAALIRWYINSFSSLTPWGRTKQTALEYLERHDIGKINADALEATMLVDHVRARRASGVAASTAGNDLTCGRRSVAERVPVSLLGGLADLVKWLETAQISAMVGGGVASAPGCPP